MNGNETAAETVSEEREHLCYADENGEPEECIEECPGCHWEGNVGCPDIRFGCDICDLDGVIFASLAFR